MYIRESTSDLYKLVLRHWFKSEEFPDELPDATEATRVRITGSPGTGKTLSLWVIFVRLLHHVSRAKLWSRVRFICQFDTASAAVFEPDDPSNVAFDFVLLDLSTTTSDGCAKNVADPRLRKGDRAFAVMTCSPDITTTAMECGFDLICVPWSLNELLHAYEVLCKSIWKIEFTPEKRDLVVKAFNIVGGVARTILEKAITTAGCKRYIQSGKPLSATKLFNVLAGCGDGGVAHKYLHVALVDTRSGKLVYNEFQPDAERKIEKKLIMASRYVEMLLCDNHCAETFAYLAQATKLDPKDGKPFEIVAHSLLRRDPGLAVELTADPEQPAMLRTIDLSKREAVLMHHVSDIVKDYSDLSPEDKAELAKYYYYPANPSHAAIDALAWASVGGVECWVLLQMTVSGEHPVKLQTMADNWTTDLAKRHPDGPPQSGEPPLKRARTAAPTNHTPDWRPTVEKFLRNALIAFVVPSFNMQTFHRQPFKAASDKGRASHKGKGRSSDTDECKQDSCPWAVRQFVLPIGLGPHSTEHSSRVPRSKREFATMEKQCTPLNLAHVSEKELSQIPGVADVTATKNLVSNSKPKAASHFSRAACKEINSESPPNPSGKRGSHEKDPKGNAVPMHATFNADQLERWITAVGKINDGVPPRMREMQRQNLLTYDHFAPKGCKPLIWHPRELRRPPTSFPFVHKLDDPKPVGQLLVQWLGDTVAGGCGWGWDWVRSRFRRGLAQCRRCKLTVDYAHCC